jgi:hypothetical protein
LSHNWGSESVAKDFASCVKVIFTGFNRRIRRQNAFDKRFALIPLLELLADMVVAEIMQQK